MTCTRKLLGQRNKRNKEENYSVLLCKSKDHERVKAPLTVSKIVAILTARGLAFGTGSVFSNRDVTQNDQVCHELAFFAFFSPYFS